MNRKPKILACIAAAMFFLSLKTFTWSVIEGQWCWSLPTEGRVTDAVVLAKEFDPSKQDLNAFKFKYQFVTEQGVSLMGWRQSNVTEYDTLKLGGKFPIVYLANDPRWNRPKWVNDEMRQSYPWRPVLSAIGLLSFIGWLGFNVLRDIGAVFGGLVTGQNRKRSSTVSPRR